MLLALDIGNTNIKCGLFDDGELQNHFTISDIKDFKSNLSDFTISKVAISSVVPGKTSEVVKELSSIINFPPYIISRDSLFNLKLKNNTPGTLGIDRICSCEGAYLLIDKKLEKGTYLLTIDFGTATTINIVNSSGVFIGGVIAPGINTMFNSLKHGTSQLPLIKTEDYKSIIGDNTNSSIASGVINSSIGLISLVIEYLHSLNDFEKIEIFITGGMANHIKKFLKIDYIHDEFLVLKGVNTVYELNRVQSN
jgi:type III pantothenate kinase